MLTSYNRKNNKDFLIVDAVSYRGKDPFSKGGNLKFEITKFYERRVSLWLKGS